VSKAVATVSEEFLSMLSIPGRLRGFESGFRHDWMMKTRVSDYVKVADAAEIFSVSQGMVRSWAETGKIPVHKNPINDYRMFKRTDLELILTRMKTPSRLK